MNKNLTYAIIAGVVFLLIFAYFSLGLNKNGSDDSVEVSESVERVELESGLVIEDIETGEGEEATSGDTVVVHYDAYLEDPENPGQKGEKFDTTKDTDSPFEATLGTGGVIAGFDQGVVGMKVGGQRTLIIPSELAYGGAGSGPIPPNSNIIFDIELLEVK